MKQKTIKELDNVIMRHLERDDVNCDNFNKKQTDFWFNELMKERITFSYLMEFGNKILGRVEVNRLCKKHNIENKY